MDLEIRSVGRGDILGMTRVILAARGLRGAELDLQIERDLARFRREGIVEQVESEALLALQGSKIVGVLRYGEFDGDVHLIRPEIDPALDAEEVTAALLRELWSHINPEIKRGTYIDYPRPEGTLGDVFLANGFRLQVGRTDMGRSMEEPVEPLTDKLHYSSYEPKLDQRFLEAHRKSFEGTLDPAMGWDARNPDKSFNIFRDRFGQMDPELWVLAHDREGNDVGFALFQPFTAGRYAGKTMLLYTAVLPDHRGHGYGEEIVREGLRRVRERRGPNAQVVLTVSDPNRPAREIYDRLGFEPLERFFVYETHRP